MCAGQLKSQRGQRSLKHVKKQLNTINKNQHISESECDSCCCWIKVVMHKEPSLQHTQTQVLVPILTLREF